MLRYLIIVALLFTLFNGCNMAELNIRSVGEAGTELLYLVPGDKIGLDSGDVGYVDAEGYLVGIQDIRILVIGRKLRDIIKELNSNFGVEFKQYKIIQFGKRYVDVRGAVQSPGIKNYPLGEDWNIMNLLINVDGFAGAGEREYLLIRKAWGFPGKHIFIRGRSLPIEEGIGGDDLLLYSQDRIIFPGQGLPVYVFGSVKAPEGGVCFTFYEDQKPPKLVDAIERAGGFSGSARTNNIEVFRVLQNQKQSIIHLQYETAKDFDLAPWDIVYVPAEIPKQIITPTKN